MAQYISGNIKGLAGVRCDLISQATGFRIESTHSVWKGGWKFTKPTPGLYDIRFFGRDVLEDDWLLNYEVNPDDTYLGGEVTYAFWNGTAPYDDSKIVKENEFGWFNQSQLKFHIAGGGENPNINIAAINYRIFYNGSWTAWIPDAPGVPATTHEMDVDIAVISNIAGENNIIEFYVAFEDGTQDMVTTVPFKYDDTAPTFNITAGAPVGGFGRIGLDWTNVDVSDPLSGIGYIVIYRDTNSSFSGSEEIARLIIVDQSVIPSSYIDDTMPQDDQSTKYFYWGKAMDRAGNLSAEARLDDAGTGTNIVLLLPADVDGALRIQNNPVGVNWEVIYGIHVPIQAVIITAGILSNVTAITAIQYKADDDDTWHDVPTPKYHDQTISYPYDISGMDEGETLTFIFPTVIQDKKYFRVVFDHANAPTEITLCHFESILAADIIVGGVLRLEKGLSIWSGSFDVNGDPTGAGMFIDKLGLQMWDAAGTVNQRLNNDGSATFGKTGVAQITISTNGLISIDTRLLNITSLTNFDPGYNPFTKRQHFSSQPSTPYWEDDLWTDGVDLRRCNSTRLTGAYNAGDWEEATDYGAKSTRWYLPSSQNPKDIWSGTDASHEGDQWVKTDLGNQLFSWTGSAWVQDYTQIDGGYINTRTLSAEKIRIGGGTEFTTDILFEPDDSSNRGDKFVKWNSGTLHFANGDIKTTIPLGTLKAVSNPRSWAYYNVATHTILLTATFADSVGDGKALMAIIDRGDYVDADNRGLCIITVINSTGTTIDGDKIITGKIQSWNGNTYFDLINNEIVMADGQITGVVAIDSELLNINSDTIFSPGYDPSKNNRRWYLPSGSNPTANPEWTGTDASHKGDQWVKTDLGNQLFTWSGSSWIADYTQIDGGSITTGIIQSFDGKTYFDLGNNLFKVNKNIDRIVIGKMATNVYGMKIYSAANVLMFQIDDNTQKITSADGNTYFDLGNNILVMENGTITAGTITGATIKTAVSGNRVELSGVGLRIYGTGFQVGAQLSFHDVSAGTLRTKMFLVGSGSNWGLAIQGSGAGTLQINEMDIQIDNDKTIESPFAHLSANKFKVDNGTVDYIDIYENHIFTPYTYYGRVKISVDGRTINHISTPNIDGFILILEHTVFGYTFNLGDDAGTPPSDYSNILTRDSSTAAYARNQPAMLMYSSGKWLVLNTESN